MRIKCGFEWHVQLDTGKLFCRCAARLHDEDSSDLDVLRRLRPSFGEGGKVDVSATFESGNGKRILYKAFRDSDCLVDLDEEPPHAVDGKALDIAFRMASALNATLFSRLIFMRKIIVDGSNTSGFQRTGIVGLGGEFKFGKKSIGISSISLEEDSARKVSDDKDCVTYKLDRLGIPLVEIATDVIDTDENEAKDIALAFGKFTRLFEVRRGIGTIRQDVNLSIEGGNRVELKGFQNVREMDKVIVNEAERQLSILALVKEKGHLKGALSDAEPKLLNGHLTSSGSDLIKSALENGKKILGMKFAGFSGLFAERLSKNKRFGTEISDYVRAHYSSGGIIHSDELPAYGISEGEKAALSTTLECGDKDAFVLSICDDENLSKTSEDIKERVRNLLSRVPSEVRLVMEDGSTRFMRPIGGKDRMYVETDLPVLSVDKSILEGAETYRGFDVDELKERYGLTDESLDLLIGVNKLTDALRLKKKFDVGFNTIVSVMVEDYRYVKRKFGFEISQDELERVVQKIAQGELPKDASRFILEAIATGRTKSVEDTIKRYGLKKMGDDALSREIRKLVSSGKFERYDTLITTLRDRLGFSFDSKDAYRLASELLKNGQDSASKKT